MSIAHHMLPTHVRPGEIHRMYPRPTPQVVPVVTLGRAKPLLGQQKIVEVTTDTKKGAGAEQVVQTLMEVAKVGNKVAKEIKPGTLVENAINKKYGTSGGPWWAKGLRAVGSFTRKHFGWGEGGAGRHVYHGSGTLPELRAAIREAVMKASKGRGAGEVENAVKEAIDSVSVALGKIKGVWNAAKKQGAKTGGGRKKKAV